MCRCRPPAATPIACSLSRASPTAHAAVAVAPRLVHLLLRNSAAIDWADTTVTLSADRGWRDALAQRDLGTRGESVAAGELLADFPVALPAGA